MALKHLSAFFLLSSLLCTAYASDGSSEGEEALRQSRAFYDRNGVLWCNLADMVRGHCTTTSTTGRPIQETTFRPRRTTRNPSVSGSGNGNGGNEENGSVVDADNDVDPQEPVDPNSPAPPASVAGSASRPTTAGSSPSTSRPASTTRRSFRRRS